MTIAPPELPPSDDTTGKRLTAWKPKIKKILEGFETPIKIVSYASILLSTLIFGSEMNQRRYQSIVASWSVLHQAQQEAAKGQTISQIKCKTKAQTVIATKAIEQLNQVSFSLSNADLSYLDLRAAALRSANLTNTNLSCTDLTGANLTDVDLTKADLTDANLSKAKMNKALSDFPGITLCRTINNKGEEISNTKSCKK
jgi:uncharacterized protein YjbI with pentapeptide repeats